MIASLACVVTGIFSGNEQNDFLLQTTPIQTPAKLNESFDETSDSLEFVAPSLKWYALQLGIYESKDSAVNMAEAFQKRGAAGFVWDDGRYRVLAAVYQNKEDAQTVRERLKEKHSVDSHLFVIELPEMYLKMNGKRGQLEILQASFSHATAVASEMQRLSVALDGQELSKEDVFEALNALKTQMDLVSLRLKQRFDLPLPACVRSYIDCFDGFSRFAEEISEIESTTELGMKLKYQTLVVLREVKSIYDSLYH